MDRETDALQSSEQALGGALGIAPVEIVAARVFVLDSVPNDVVGDDQDFVRDGHGGLLHAAAAGDLIEHGGEAAVLPVRYAPGVLDEQTAEVAAALTRAAGQAFACALVLPGHRPAQLARWLAVGNTLISTPISATMPHAVR